MTLYDALNALTWLFILAAGFLWGLWLVIKLAVLVGIAWLIIRAIRAPKHRRRERIRGRLEAFADHDMHPNLRRAAGRIDTRPGTDRDALNTCNAIWNTDKEETK